MMKSTVPTKKPKLPTVSHAWKDFDSNQLKTILSSKTAQEMKEYKFI
jgi:hypothetical protein